MHKIAQKRGFIHSKFYESTKNFSISASFSPKGKIALMILKHYSSVSDKKLIEQLNGNIEFQYFCDIYLGTNRIDNYKIVSQIRTELSKHLILEYLQKVMYQHWKDHISNPSHIVMDATCYESELRYPTNKSYYGNLLIGYIKR